MAHFKRRKKTDHSRRHYGQKTFLVAGLKKRDYWDNVPSMNSRQRLKTELRREIEAGE